MNLANPVIRNVDLTRRKRKPPVFLTEQEKWAIAVYCIENKCVMIDNEGKFTRYRMFFKHIKEEVESLIGKQVNEYHIKDSMDFYHTINDIVKLVPHVPLQESVQEDQLKAELQRVMASRDELARRVEALEFLYGKTVMLLEDSAKKMVTLYRTDYATHKKEFAPK